MATVSLVLCAALIVIATAGPLPDPVNLPEHGEPVNLPAGQPAPVQLPAAPQHGDGHTGHKHKDGDSCGCDHGDGEHKDGDCGCDHGDGEHTEGDCGCGHDDEKEGGGGGHGDHAGCKCGHSDMKDTDTDGDGIPDGKDVDDDGDGIPDSKDPDDGCGCDHGHHKEGCKCGCADGHHGDGDGADDCGCDHESGKHKEGCKCGCGHEDGSHGDHKGGDCGCDHATGKHKEGCKCGCDHGRHGDHGGQGGHKLMHGRRQRHRHAGGKIWRFQIGDSFGAYEYVDTDGYLKGFHVDLVKAGLLGNWYDGCVGYFPSPERLNSFNFTVPFTPNVKAALHVIKGSDKQARDFKDLTGRKIGFVDGWALGKRCLDRQFGYKGLNKYTTVIYQTHEELINAIMGGEVDYIMTADAVNGTALGLQAIEPWFTCTTGGSSVMLNYGCTGIEWWNAAFEGMVKDGTYKKLCDDAKQHHGYRGPLFCLQ